MSNKPKFIIPDSATFAAIAQRAANSAKQIQAEFGILPNFISTETGTLPDSTGAVADTTKGAYFTDDDIFQLVLWDGDAWQDVGEPISTKKYVDDKTSLSVANVVVLRQTPPVNPAVSGQRINLTDEGVAGGWRWIHTSTADDNFGTVAKVEGIETGRWHRFVGLSVDVAWFGAKADDEFDNREAFRGAIALKRGIVKASETGVYRFSKDPETPDGITAIDGLTLIGSGKETIFKWLDSVDIEGQHSVIGDGGVPVKGVTLRDFTVDGNKQRSSTPETFINVFAEGINLDGEDITIDNVVSQNTLGEAFDHDATKNLKLSNCIAKNANGNGFHLADVDQENSNLNNLTAINCGFVRRDEFGGRFGGFVLRGNGIQASNLHSIDCARGLHIEVLDIDKSFNISNVTIESELANVDAINSESPSVGTCNISGLTINLPNADRVAVIVRSTSRLNVSSFNIVTKTDVSISVRGNGVFRGSSFEIEGGTNAIRLQGSGKCVLNNGSVTNDSSEGATITSLEGSEFELYGVTVEGGGTNGLSIQSTSRAKVVGGKIDGDSRSVRVMNTAKIIMQGVETPSIVLIESNDNIIMNNDMESITDSGSGNIIKNNVIGGTFVADGVS